LIADGVDVALRLGSLPDSSVIARKLAEAPRVLVASPVYLKRRGWPRDPEDLASHAIIMGPGAANPNAWTFAKGGRRASARVEGRLTTAANEGATAGAVAGLGITITSLWACPAEIKRGELIRIMEAWEMPAVELHALFPSGRAASPAAGAFIDYLAPQL
jgi:DNA-binding transcriptional LysR family regulator